MPCSLSLKRYYCKQARNRVGTRFLVLRLLCFLSGYAILSMDFDSFPLVELAHSFSVKEWAFSYAPMSRYRTHAHVSSWARCFTMNGCTSPVSASTTV